MKRVTVAIGVEFACRALGGLLLGAPFAAAVQGSGIGRFPAGDRLLFEPGGLMLTEVVRSVWSTLPSLGAVSVLTGTLAGLLLVLPRAFLLMTLAEKWPEPLPLLLARTSSRVPAWLAVTGGAFLAQVLVGTLGLALAGATRSATAVNQPRSDALTLACALAGGLCVLGLGVWRDLASVSLTSGEPNALLALRSGLRALRARPAEILGRWLGPNFLGLSLVGAAALATVALDVSRPEGARLLAVTLLHQAAVLALVVCRASWLKSAIALVEPRPEAAQPAVASSALR